MSRSQGAAAAIIDAPHLGGAIVTTRASVLDEPAIGDRRDSRLVGFKVGQSEKHRSVWESPRRGAVQAVGTKRAGKGGRAVRIRVRDGLAMDPCGRPCTSGRTQRAG